MECSARSVNSRSRFARRTLTAVRCVTERSGAFLLALTAAVCFSFGLACGGSGNQSFQGPGNDGGSNGSDSGGGGGSGGSSGGSGSSSGSSSGSDSGASSGSSSGASSGSSSGGVSGNVSILVYPNGNHAAELIAAINGATTSVYMTMYDIDDSGVIGAITSAKGRGLDVKVILDGSSTTRSNNQGAYSSFSGYVTWSSSSFTYTHEKCVMIDHKQAWIMTANAESSVPEYNREYLAIDDGLADVIEAEAIFKADYANQSYSPNGDLVVANSNARPDLVKPHQLGAEVARHRGRGVQRQRLQRHHGCRRGRRRSRRHGPPRRGGR